MTDSEDLIAQIYAGAAAGSCPSTARGYVWYCDVHDTHGNADSQPEAQYVAAAHAAYFRRVNREDSPCDLYIEQAGTTPGGPS